MGVVVGCTKPVLLPSCMARLCIPPAECKPCKLRIGIVDYASAQPAQSTSCG